ncbi:MAG TPA: gamma-glutamyl-gamma-aminobutyrate hydrolase family protein [Gemmatimonadaceae bacterium]
MTTPFVAITATSRVHDAIERVRVNQAYVQAVESRGLVPLVVPPLAEPAHVARILDRVDGLVLTGGEDVNPARYGAAPHEQTHPPHDRRDATEIALVLEAERRALPTLAICRGLQVVNVALGGTLVQDLPSERPASLAHDGAERDARVHEVRVRDGSRLAHALGATCVVANSSHHQAIDRLAPGLVATAVSSDGVIEGIELEAPGWWMLGVQWHPEELVGTPEDWDRRLFEAFAAACAQRAVR